MINNKPWVHEEAQTDDINQEIKNLNKFKPVSGVKFTEYDQFGFLKGSELSKLITTDESVPDLFIEAPAQMLELAMARPKGHFKDYDKDVKDMNEEGKCCVC